ncbi:MAG TPA: glycosyltransferase family 4 protein [Thermoplasmata archaeon]|nr:glycosyltransferase family 4 protein [Thermoplasmata archaeon]
MLAYTFYETDNRVRRYAETCAKRGDHVDAIVLRREGQPFYDTLNGVNIYRIQKRKVNETGKLSYLIKLTRFLIKSSIFLTKKQFKNRYDLIHVHNPPDFHIFATWFPKLTGSKIILDIHDILPEFYANKFSTSKNSIIYKLLLFIERVSAAFADHVIISNHIWAETFTSRSATKDKCTVLLNYPDTQIFYKRHKTRKNGKFIMIYPGTLNKHQGLDIAVKAFANINDKIPEAEFHIYGEGSTKILLINLVSQLNLEGKVVFHELVSMEKIADVMANADLGIIPKRNDPFGGEAFSTKTLEFMALGIPIIVSKTKIDQYYFDESIVKFFEPGNEKDLSEAMLLLIQDQELRNSLIANADKYMEKYNWEVKKQIYLDLVDSLTAQ